MSHAPRGIALVIIAAAGCGPSTAAAPPPRAPIASAPPGEATAGGPTVAAGDPEHAGYVDTAILRRLIRRELGQIRACYEQGLMGSPGLAGTVTVRFTISPTGAVSEASATGLTAPVATCVADRIKTIAFPRPREGIVMVTWPFQFSQNG